jgi:leucyl aminopeptidase (aminopeptidase T)
MASISPDVSSRLKPDAVAVIKLIYEDVCNLQPGTNVLVIADARTPDYIVATFQGMALALGAEAVTIECRIPVGGATYQPGSKWPKMLEAAAMEADLIVDMAVGYAEFIVEAVKNGARVMCPGDGIGGPFMDDVLIRTMLHTDIHAIRRHADRIAQRFSEASTCTVITGDDELVIDLTDVEGASGCGFLWDPDKQDWKSNWTFLPPAQPGILVPKGRGTGSINVDGTLLYHPDYHEKPDSPLRLTFRDGHLEGIDGDRILAARLENWLTELDDEGAYYGPVHLNIGNNPNAVLSQSQEWERVYGSITCGMGDFSLLGGLIPGISSDILNQSAVHWDWTVLHPKILLDDKVFAENGKIFA